MFGGLLQHKIYVICVCVSYTANDGSSIPLPGFMQLTGPRNTGPWLADNQSCDLSNEFWLAVYLWKLVPYNFSVTGGAPLNFYRLVWSKLFPTWSTWHELMKSIHGSLVHTQMFIEFEVVAMVTWSWLPRLPRFKICLFAPADEGGS